LVDDDDARRTTNAIAEGLRGHRKPVRIPYSVQLLLLRIICRHPSPTGLTDYCKLSGSGPVAGPIYFRTIRLNSPRV
jgi:hypothetical protein